MVVPAGRTNRLFGWNAYEWKVDYKYVAAGWTVTPTPADTSASIAITPPTPVVYPWTGPGGVVAVMGLLYSIRGSQGYERKSSMIPAAAAGVITLRELRPATSYYVIPVMRTIDGSIIRGPQSTVTTTGTLEINPFDPRLLALLLIGAGLGPNLPEPPEDG
jgi:hypothetical protein